VWFRRGVMARTLERAPARQLAPALLKALLPRGWSLKGSVRCSSRDRRPDNIRILSGYYPDTILSVVSTPARSARRRLLSSRSTRTGIILARRVSASTVAIRPPPSPCAAVFGRPSRVPPERGIAAAGSAAGSLVGVRNGAARSSACAPRTTPAPQPDLEEDSRCLISRTEAWTA
jgi:hypothetical protein